MSFHICVPSYNRPKVINEKTLSFLGRMGMNEKFIDIIVETEDMKVDYLNINPKLNIIVSNTNGIKEKRNFVRSYYQNNTNITNLVCVDDDIDEIMDWDKPITQDRFYEVIEEGFKLCHEKKLCVWGVSPFHNTFFLKKNVSTNLKYICGAFFGLVIDRDKEVLQTSFDHYEDFCFTCQHFLRDGGVLRFNDVALKTKYFNPNGGITGWYGGKEERAKAQKQDALRFVELYPQMAKIITKKYGDDLRLNHRFKSPVNNNN